MSMQSARLDCQEAADQIGANTFGAATLSNTFGSLADGLDDLEFGDGNDRAMSIEEITRFMEAGSEDDGALFEADDGAPVDQADDVEKESYAPSIDEGDFADPAQRALFGILKKHIRASCNVNIGDKQRMSAIEWIFVPSLKDKDQIDFDTACIALCARPLVVRARVAHKLWESGIILPGPLPFLSALPPSSLISEIDALLGGMRLRTIHSEIARAVWSFPSIHAEELMAMFKSESTRDEYVAAINGLLAEGYLGVNASRFYFISRNPANLSLRQRAHWQFAASILGDS